MQSSIMNRLKLYWSIILLWASVTEAAFIMESDSSNPPSPHEVGKEYFNVLLHKPLTTTLSPIMEDPFGHIRPHGLIGDVHDTSIKNNYRYFSSANDCKLSIKEGHLKTSDQILPVNVMTLGKMYTFSPSKIGDMKFFGHLAVQQGNCFAILKGKSLCDTASTGSHSFDDDCDPSNESVIIVFISMSTFLTLALWIIIRYMYIRFKYAPTNYRVLRSSPGLFKFTHEIVADDYHSSLAFNRAKDQVAVSIPSSMSKIKFNFWKIMVAILLFSYPQPTVGVPSHNTYHDIKGSEGSFYKIGNNTLRITKGHQIFPIQLDYLTSNWDIEVNQNYYCWQTDCDNNGPCTSYGPLGKFSSDRLTESENHKPSYFRSQKFCSVGDNGCAFTKGCKKWEAKFNYDKLSFSPVFSLGQGRSIVSVSMVGDDDTYMITSTLENDFSPVSMSIVKYKNSTWFLCPFSTSKANPHHSNLGDVQINEHLLISQDHRIVDCSTTVSSWAQCSIQEAFLPNVPFICKELPAQVGSFSVELNDGYLISKQEGNVKVTINQDGPSTPEVSQPDCSIKSVDYYDLRSDFFPSYIVIQTSLGGEFSSVKYSLPCSGEIVEMKCNGELHQFEMPSLVACKIKDSKVVIHTIVQDELDFYHGEGMNNPDHSHYIPSASFYASNLGLSFPIILTFFIGCMLLALTIFLCCYCLCKR